MPASENAISEYYSYPSHEHEQVPSSAKWYNDKSQLKAYENRGCTSTPLEQVMWEAVEY
jgi:hypothetical protein